jgi:hypothetical protein
VVCSDDAIRAELSRLPRKARTTVNLAYMGEPPAALTPEQEEELPPELRRK